MPLVTLAKGSVMSDAAMLEVYEAGEITVIGFGGREILDHLNLADCREQIVALVKQHDSRVMAFDLTGVKLVPSGMLGLLASVSKLGVEVHLYNASNDIREILEITHLDQVLQLHDVPVG